MKSPFTFFRRHQKVMLAGLGVMAMFGFVILPVILEGLQFQRAANIVVATSRFGTLRESSLAELMRQRGLMLRFLNTVADALLQVGEPPQEVQRVFGEIGPAAEEAVVERWLLARYAERLGLVVDNRLVNQFIAELTRGKISGQALEQMLDRQGISTSYLFRVISEELLALRAREILLTNLAGATPAQHWDYFQRLNRRAVVETVAVPVERFVDQVADPPERQLREFFETYRYRVPHPDSPEPGFMEPKRISVEWVKAPFDRFVEKLREQVTDQEIEAYYNENRDRLYKREPLPTKPIGEAADQQRGEPTSAPRQPEAVTPPAGAVPQPAAEPQAPIGPSETQGQQSPAPGPTAMPETPADSQEPPNTPPEASPERTPETNAPSPPAADGPSPAADPSSQEPVSPVDSTGQNSPAAEPGDGDGADPPTAEQSQPKEQAPGGAEQPAPTPSTEPAAETSSQPPPRSSEYIPLEKVREEIRSTLARQKAVQTVQQLLEKLQAQLTRYREEKVLYDLEVQQRKSTGRPEPQRPNLQALAQEHHLDYQKTELLADYEFEQLEIARATTAVGGSVLEMIFYRLPLFRPTIARDMSGNQYLVWKLEETEARVPELSDADVRQKVIRSWKMLQARSLARAEAEKLAQQAREVGKPLAEVFANRTDLKVETSEPFSWLTTTLPLVFWYQEPPRISQVRGVDRPGEEFMRTVFRMKPGQVGVAMNHPQTTAYVIRVVETQPSDEILWQQFISEPARLYLVAAQVETASGWVRLLDHVRKEARFQWSAEWQRRRAERPPQYD
jgi:hypothetical protein